MEPETESNAAQPDVNGSAPKSQQAPFLVVGLGASAGGLQALEAFFGGLPETDGAAFVVVIHLDPDRESEMAEILARSVPIPVTQVEDAAEVHPGHVYVIPPNRNLAMADGHLRLAPLEDERHRRRPIDHFFRTLGDAYGAHAVGVVLSGTGHNGTVGVRRIKERGGLVLAQDPGEAEFGEMPRSAIASGQVDQVAPAARLAHAVIAYSEHLHRVRLPGDGSEDLPDDDVQSVRRILALLHTRTGHDFAAYKRATVLRRLSRRLHVVGVDSLNAYFAHLGQHPGEVGELLKDLLISVTNFFRDPDTFDRLERHVIPALFEGKGADAEVRVWVAGCATGEEAYSVAMLLEEHAARLAAPPAFQVFATDLSEHAIQTARAGLYPASIEADVSAERLGTFFHKTAAGYRVREALRERVLFAPHSLLKDPPFAHLDLVSCRNLLIYLQPALQRRVLELFHYALRPAGWLFLGASETAHAARDLFTVADKRAQVYRPREVEAAITYIPYAPRQRGPRPPAASVADEAADAASAAPSVAAIHQKLRAAYAPSVLVDEAHNVVHLSDGTAPFLQMSGGEPTQSLLRLVLPALRPAVQTALFQARRQAGPFTSPPVRLDLDGSPVSIRVRAEATDVATFTQIAFETERATPSFSDLALSTDERAQVLQQEVQETREQLQLSIEEFETSREELRSQNEELQSINEELRSTAEELETSKEEARSVAEDLQTVNDVLKGKVDELAQSRGDLENLVAATEIATLFLDKQLRIQWFTPSVRHHFHVRSSDVGRPLADLEQKFGSIRLIEDAEAVLARLDAQVREVEDADGRWYLVQVRPYRDVDDRIAGVVVTFVDITERKRQETEIRQSEERYRLLVASTTEYAIAMLDLGGQIVSWNAGAREAFGYGEAEALGQDIALIFTPEDRAAGVPQAEMEVARRDGRASDDRWLVRKDGSPFWASGLLTALRYEDGTLHGFAKILRDDTERKEIEDALRASEERLRQALTVARMGTWDYDAERNLMRLDARAQAAFGFDRKEGAPEEIAANVHPDDAGAFEAARDASLAVGHGGTFSETHRVVDPDGTVRWVRGQTQVFFEGEGAARRLTHSIGVVLDVTEQHEAEAIIRASEERFRAMAETIPDVLFTTDADGVIDYMNRQIEALAGTLPEALLGTSMWPGLAHPDDRPRVEQAWAAAAAQRETFELRYRLCTSDGAYCWVITRARPLHDAEGGLTRWFGTLTDVNALTEAEQALHALNEDLEARVDERTAQVLHLARRLTTAEQQERERLAQVLHDDLQQQLFGMSVMLGMLATAADEDRRARLNGQVTTTLDAVIHLTRTLATELSPPVMESEKIDDLLKWLALREEDQRGLHVDVEVRGPCALPDRGLRVLLYQILRELLLNVTKYAGVKMVRLEAWKDDSAVHIQVRDEGAGFDVEMLQTEVKATGGFGFNSIRERLKMVGGHIEIDSSPGAGTRVTVSLPVDAAEGA